MKYRPEDYRCSRHPKYKAIRLPRTECNRCWRHYYARDRALYFGGYGEPGPVATPKRGKP